MRYLLFLFALVLPLVFVVPAKADTLTLWTENGIVAGQTYGLELCQVRCSQSLLAEIGPFADTGLPQEMFYPATHPVAATFIAYLMNPISDPWTYVFTMGNSGSYVGRGTYFPIQGAIIDSLFISSTGDTVTYGVTGTNLVPEPGEWVMLLAGLGALIGLSLQAKRKLCLASSRLA